MNINKQFFLIIIIISLSTSDSPATNIGAYVKTPNPDELQFRLGNGIGGFESSWSIDNVRNLMEYAGYDGMRKKLPEQHFVNWGYGIELGVCEINEKHGILDVVGYLCTPSKEHSSNKSSVSEACLPANLYEPIWLSNGEVNPNNYWAAYINKTVSTYKKYIKIWETWNEPDYVRNVDTSKWETSPPNPSDLTHWYGSIFEYIRLLRITYEVAKKVDPDCWVATGGLGYPYFLDGIMRYTDNPVDGSVTKDYPALGGAYFDCDAFHKYPKWGSYDMQNGESIDGKGSDSHAKKVVTLKKNHHYIIKKYGFGDKYPAKIFICTETGLDSEGEIGGNLVRRNWIIKLALLSIEYDVRQHHQLYFSDDGTGGGDYQKIGKFVSIEEGYKHLKSSSKGRRILKQMNLGKYVFDQNRTTEFRNSLKPGLTGIVLKRKFPKEENETYYSDYMYSAWIECINEEVEGEVKTKLKIPIKNILQLNWEGKRKRKKKNSEFTVTNTPIFLLDNVNNYPDDDDGKGGLSGAAIFFIVVFVLIGIVFLALVGLYLYKRFIKNQYLPLDKNLIGNLLLR